MSTLQCDEIEMALPALALGALDEDERTTVLEHLDHCPDCQVQFAQYLEVSNQLLVAVPQRMPPPFLKKSLMQRVEPVKERWNRRLANWLKGSQTIPRWPVLAAFAVMVLIVSLFGFETLRLADQQTALSTQVAQQQQALLLLTGSTTSMVSMTGTSLAASASAYMRYNPQDTMAVVETINLPPLPEGKVYQLWLIDSAGQHDSGAVFSVPAASNGTTLLVIMAPRPMQNYVGCGVSIEPKGGSKSPTGPAVLKGDLWS